jgi:hypothetical protein
MSDDAGFTILMSPIQGLRTLPLYRLYFGVAFNADGTQTDMGLRYLTTDLAEVRHLESLGSAGARESRSGTYFRELGVNDGTGILGYIFATSQPGTVTMSQIYRTDLVTRSHRRGSDGPLVGSSLQEQGDHVYTTRPVFDMSRYGTWRQETVRGYVRELTVIATGSQQPARLAALHRAIEVPTIATGRTGILDSRVASLAALPAMLATARDVIVIDARPVSDRDRIVAARQRSAESTAVIAGPAELHDRSSRMRVHRRVTNESEARLVDSLFCQWSDLVEQLSWDAERAVAPSTSSP